MRGTRTWLGLTVFLGLVLGGCAHGKDIGRGEDDDSRGGPTTLNQGVKDTEMIDVRSDGTEQSEVAAVETKAAELEAAAEDSHAAAPEPRKRAERPARPGPIAPAVTRRHGGMAMGSSGGYGAPSTAFVEAPPLDREGYDHIDANKMVAVADEPLSTFGIDVDTASYANVRRFLNNGSLPPPSAVRVEEMINYFRYEFAEPTGDDAFSITTSVAGCPWAPEHRLLQIGVRGKEIPDAQLPPRNLVFLIDVSGSMYSADKLPLLKQSFALLVDSLREEDKVAMVVYAGNSGLVLPATRGTDRGAILSALERLEAGGSTNGGEGIELAYKVATQNFVRGGINRVILASDGDFNVGVSSRGELERLIEKKRESGVFLSVLGFGQGNLQDSTMEMLARKGNGNYSYIDSLNEAKKVLVRESGSTLHTIAKDVKIQVEWNPANVKSYRLIGYENRILAARDFNDDKKDAGDIGAGHTVTALYEVVPAGAESGTNPQVDPLRYFNQTPSGSAHREELATVKVRFKRPDGDTSRLITRPVAARASESNGDLRFAAAVAGFGLWLRQDPEVATLSLGKLRQLAESGIGADPHGDRRELLALMKKAEQLRPHHTSASLGKP
jgi:Ca-activated chloride channel homolog